MDNETATQSTQLVAQAAQADPTGAILLAAMLLGVFLIGLLFGAVASRPNIPRARVRLRALRHYLNSPQECNDELVQSLTRLEIRRMETRLKIDEDQD